MSAGARKGCLVALGLVGGFILLAVVKDMADDPTVAAMVRRIDRRGGAVGASQELYSGVTRIRKESGKPIVASFGDVAASGAYYTACATDTIFADPGTLTGSIGV